MAEMRGKWGRSVGVQRLSGYMEQGAIQTPTLHFQRQGLSP